MPRKPRKVSQSKHDTSGQSTNSSYRDSSHYSEESSQDSSPRSASKDDSQDETDFVHCASGSHSDTSYLEMSSDGGSPYSKLREQLSEMNAQNVIGPSPAFKDLHISPDFRKRSGTSPEDQEYHSPSPRRPLRTDKHSSPAFNSPLPPAQTRTRRNNEDGHRWFFDYYKSEICWICVVVVLLLFYVLIIQPAMNVDPAELKETDELNDREILVNNFEREFKEFMALFPAQTIRFWKILKASTKSVLRESEPRMPIVIIMVSNEGAHESAMCITKRFSELITKVYGVQGPVEIHNQQVLQYSEASNLKKFLDVTLQQAFENTRVAVIHEIDKIPGEAAMIFHAYCDNEFAPYKDAAIIFTIQNEGEILADDNDVENFLEEKWEEELDKDKRGALIYSRIANNIAFVKEEKEIDVTSACP